MSAAMSWFKAQGRRGPFSLSRGFRVRAVDQASVLAKSRSGIKLIRGTKVARAARSKGIVALGLE